MKSRIVCLAIGLLLIAVAVAAPAVKAQRKHQNAVIDIWTQNKPVFGVYVPSMGQPLWSEPAPPPAAPGARGGGGNRGGGPPQARPDPVYTRDIGEALGKDPLVDFV